MKRTTRLMAAASVLVAAAGVGLTSASNAAADGVALQTIIFEHLSGFEEDPLVFSTPGSATFAAVIKDRDQQIDYRLSWKDLPTNVAQSHIHLGGPSQSGGISVFLCSNLGNGPAGTQACPAAGPGTVTGTIKPVDVIGPAAQGIAAGEFAELVTAIRAGATYVNVHTAERPGGEVRGQIEHGH